MHGSPCLQGVRALTIEPGITFTRLGKNRGVCAANSLVPLVAVRVANAPFIVSWLLNCEINCALIGRVLGKKMCYLGPFHGPKVSKVGNFGLVTEDR